MYGQEEAAKHLIPSGGKRAAASFRIIKYDLIEAVDRLQLEF